VQPPIAFESEDIATARGFVAAGLGWAVLPGDELAAGSPVRCVDLAERGARREIGTVWSTRRDRTPAAEAFLEFLRESQSRPARP
jgi:DNA-binding transcriptional LysR family regulator